MIVGIIELIDGFLRPEEVGIHCLLHGIPLFNTYEHIPPAQEPEHSTDLSGVGDLPVYEIVFDQSPDLSVQHPVELCEQDHVIAIMPVLGKKDSQARRSGEEYSLELKSSCASSM